MKNKNKIFISISFVFLISVITFATVFFEAKERDIIKDFTEEHLIELANLYSVTFNEKLNDQLSLLESQSRYFDDVDMTDYSAMKDRILKTKGAGQFKRISISDLTGMTINYNGRSSGNIYNTDYFKRAIETGKSQISMDKIIDEDKETVLAMSVPVIQKGKVTGVVTGTISYSILSNLFSKSILNSDSLSFVVSAKNSIIISSQNLLDQDYLEQQFKSVFNNNFFTPKQIDFLNSLDKSKPNVYVYQIDGNDFTLISSPLNFNNWTYMYIFPYDFIKAQERKLATSVYFIILTILMAFLIFTYSLQSLIRSNESVEKDNERLKIANAQSQSLVFEINLQKNNIVFTGDTEFILNTRETIFPLNYLIQEFLARIHEDDRSAISNIKDFISLQTETFSNEIRFKCADEDYYWFKFSGTKVQTGNNVKLIGHFENVNAQIIHEQELKTIAETDLLSGLLNKSFTEKKIERYLSIADTSSICALFVVDLDNFKKTNDTLGHAMGDMALRDTAKKITLNFSEKDIMGRFGGDEFCIFMRLKNISDIKMAEKIITEKAANLCSLLNEEYFDDKNSVTISSSIGISIFPDNGKSFKELFQKADTALYYVKQHGKNNFKIYTEDLPEFGELIYE